MANRSDKLVGLQWDQANVEASLNEVCEFVLEEAERQSHWYRRKAGPKRVLSQSVRVIAVLSAASAGVLPILSQIFANESGSPVVHPAWATVAVGIGLGALALDRFFGFSTGWMRFITTEMTMSSKIEEFRLETSVENMGRQGKPPTSDQANATLSRCAAFASEMSGFALEETRAWVLEFQENLKDLDDRLTARAQTRRTGSLIVRVENGNQCDDGWTLSMDGRGQLTRRGKSAAFSDVYPGDYVVAVEGQIEGRSVFAESVVAVGAAETANLDLFLE